MKHDVTNKDDDAEFARFGRAAVIPGIQKAIEYLQEMLFDLQARMGASESLNAAPRVTARAVVNRITKAERISKAEPVKTRAKTSSSGLKEYWAKMTPEEKSAEMRRRGMAGRKRLIKKNPNINADHPGKPTHPDHAQWLINVQRGREAAKRARARAAKAVAA